MTRPLPRMTALALGATVIAGCAGQPVIENTYRDSYYPHLLTYAASKGGMKTDILGSPFGGSDRAQLEETVTRRLSEATPGVKMDYFTEAPAGHSSPYRVVMLFDPAPGQPVHDLCARPDLKSQPPGDGEVEVTAAFCQGGKAFTRLDGHVGNVESPSDPAFQDFIGQVARGLFPYSDVERDSGAGDFDA